MNKISFINAIIEINKREDLELCDDLEELNGIHKSICVYKDGEFIGKLYWCTENRPVSIDECLQKELNNDK